MNFPEIFSKCQSWSQVAGPEKWSPAWLAKETWPCPSPFLQCENLEPKTGRSCAHPESHGLCPNRRSTWGSKSSSGDEDPENSVRALISHASKRKCKKSSDLSDLHKFHHISRKRIIMCNVLYIIDFQYVNHVKIIEQISACTGGCKRACLFHRHQQGLYPGPFLCR